MADCSDNSNFNSHNSPDNLSTSTIMNTTNTSNTTATKLTVFYQLAHRTKSSINSNFYAATGIKLDQKKLVISFIFTLLKDFGLAYTARAGIKLIPRLVKMLQSLKYKAIGIVLSLFNV